MKFKFEKWNIAEIGASQSKTNSILYLDKEGHLKSNITSKGITSCCIDDDNPKRPKETGAFYMKTDDNGEILYDKMEIWNTLKKILNQLFDMLI